MKNDEMPELDISTVREGVRLMLERNGGPTSDTIDGKTYVLVLAQDFVALEHYHNLSKWVDTASEAARKELEKELLKTQDANETLHDIAAKRTDENNDLQARVKELESQLLAARKVNTGWHKEYGDMQQRLPELEQDKRRYQERLAARILSKPKPSSPRGRR